MSNVYTSVGKTRPLQYFSISLTTAE